MSPPPELLERARALGAAPLCDALGRRHSHRLHVDDLIGPPASRPLLGPVATLRFLPLRPDLHDEERQSFNRLAARAREAAPEGAILVAAAGDPAQPVAGGKKMAELIALGFGGLLTDARVRDLAEADEMGLPVWCRGEAIRNANDVLMAWEVGTPVDVAGVCVSPGDWVYADAAGAVVVPTGEIERTLDEAEQLAARDDQIVTDALARAGTGRSNAGR